MSKGDDGLHAYKHRQAHMQTKCHLVAIVADVDVDSPIKIGGGSRWPVSSGAALARASASAARTYHRGLTIVFVLVSSFFVHFREYRMRLEGGV